MAIPELITVQNGQWVNLYSAANISVGTQIIVQNFSSKSLVAYSDTANEPVVTDGRVAIAPQDFYQNDTGDAGAWAYCASFAQISVQEA